MTTQDTVVVATTDNLYYDDYVTAKSEKPDNASVNRFKRSNIHDVVEMINSVLDKESGISADDYQVVEWMLHEKLPGITGSNTVRAWINDEFATLKPHAPAWITKGAN